MTTLPKDRRRPVFEVRHMRHTSRGQGRVPHRRQIVLAATLGMLAVFVSPSAPQAASPISHGRNYEEAKVGTYTLPDPLVGKDGQRVTDTAAWRTTRRGEILQDFRDLMYGIGSSQWPSPDQPVGHTVGYHLRTGEHAITPSDWQQFLNFADRHFRDSTRR